MRVVYRIAIDKNASDSSKILALAPWAMQQHNRLIFLEAELPKESRQALDKLLLLS
jgi:hypothetical protein